MANNSLSNEVLEEIAYMVKRYLEGKINTNSIYKYERHISFGQYSNILHQDVGFSYYPESKRFAGYVNNIGDFTGIVGDRYITVNCSRSSNSAFISLS